MTPPVIALLLVEDNPGDIRLAQETLKEYKLQNRLHIVGDGEQALQFLRRQGPFADAAQIDMVLLDLHLPKVDGVEVLTELRKDPKLQDIPVVVLTSTKVDRDFLRRFDIKADCFVQKPLTVERYLDAVRCFPQFGVSIVRLARGA